MPSSVSLDQKVIDRIDALVASGRYVSREEVLDVATHRLADRIARVREIEAHIDQGLSDIDAGRVHSVEEVRAHFRQQA